MKPLSYMKINDLQELKPVYIHEASYPASDEISLINLATILVRRKTMIMVIILTFIVLGITVAIYTPKTYNFSTSIEIGSQIIGSSVEPFEPPQALLAKLQHSYIPQTLIEHKQSNPDDEKKYRIKSSVPAGSNLTLLEVNGTENQGDTIKGLLLAITQKAILDHERIYEAVKQNFITSKNLAMSELASLSPDNIDHEEKIQILKNKIESYNSQLANLRNTREILPPMKSIEPTSVGKNIIVIIATIAGVFLGMFAAFTAEFISRVKDADL